MESAAPLLMIMARVPELGRVKTRLGHALGSEAALVLHTAMLEDTFQLAKRTAVNFREVSVCWAADRESAPPTAWVKCQPGFRHDLQGGGSLGERLSRAFERELPSGPAICIGTDSPTLPDEYLAAGAAAVRQGSSNAVFGPARDGGYYLVGLSKYASAVFQGIDWGTDRVLAQSVSQAERAGLVVSLLPVWYDVDRPEDLSLLLEATGAEGARKASSAEVARTYVEGARS